MAVGMTDSTFIAFQMVEERFQEMINSGMATKVEILRLLEEGLTEFNWFQGGYDTAAGERGSGWMAVGISELDEYRNLKPYELVENIEEWCGTDAWSSEVGELMRKIFENDPERLTLAKDDWVQGYVACIYDKLGEESDDESDDLDNELVEVA